MLFSQYEDFFEIQEIHIKFKLDVDKRKQGCTLTFFVHTVALVLQRLTVL